MATGAGRTGQDKLLSTLGLCAKARGLVVGTPMVCDALRAPTGGQRVLAVLEASDTSDNTHGRLASKCAYYGVPLYRIHATTEVLAHTIGKSGATAAVGVVHEGLWSSMAKYLPQAETDSEQDPVSL